MDTYNSFEELAAGQAAKDNLVSNNAQFNVRTENMPHMTLDGHGIDFRIERHDQDDRKSDGEPVDAPPISSAAERQRLYNVLRQRDMPFHGVISAGNHMLAAYAGGVLYYIPNKESSEYEVKIGSMKDVAPNSVQLTDGWETKVFID